MAKIMFVVPRISGGGAEKVITSLASEMSAGHDVCLVTTVREDGQEAYALSDSVRYINLYAQQRPVIKYLNYLRLGCSAVVRKTRKNIRKHLLLISPDSESGRKPASRTSYAFHIHRLKKLKKQLGIDCSVSFLNSANYINAMSDAGERRVISIRSCPSGPYAPKECLTAEGREQIRESCRLADTVVPVSLEAGDALVDEFDAKRTKMQVIYNYVDRDDIAKRSQMQPQGPSPDRIPAGAPGLPELLDLIDQAGFVFVSLARLTEKKGHWHMIRAFRKVVNVHPEASLIILGKTGKGEEDTTSLLRQAIRENALEGHVILAGFYSNPYALMKKSDAFVMTSFNEGFPNALVEAMALSLPVIAADCSSGPREILAPDTDCHVKAREAEYAPYGILVPECSGVRKTGEPLETQEEILAGTMIRLIDDSDLREHYRQQSLTRVQAFEKETILNQWKTVIDDKSQH